MERPKSCLGLTHQSPQLETMKNIIHFDYGTGLVTVKAYGKVKLPKIGESVNMSYIIPNEEEKKNFFDKFGRFSITVVDISRQIDYKSKEHHVEINLSNDFSDNDILYQAMMN